MELHSCGTAVQFCSILARILQRLFPYLSEPHNVSFHPRGFRGIFAIPIPWQVCSTDLYILYSWMRHWPITYQRKLSHSTSDNRSRIHAYFLIRRTTSEYLTHIESSQMTTVLPRIDAPDVYLRPVASFRGNTVNVLNILRWYTLCENIHGFYSCYRPVISGDGVATVVCSCDLLWLCQEYQAVCIAPL